MPISREDTVLRTTAETASSQPAQTAQQTLPVVARPLNNAPAAQPEPERRRWLWVAGSLMIAGLTGLMVLQSWSATIPVVAVETVLLGPVTRILAVNGRIAGVTSVDVQPLVSGTVVEVLVAEGDTVVRGDTLVQLDTAAQQAIVKQAVAGLDVVLVAQEDAKAILERTRALGGNAARMVLEGAARAEQTAAQEVARMTALLEQAQIQLTKFTIRAPIAGTVLILHADLGQSADPVTSLLTIADLGQLVVETDVDESYATQIRTGQAAALQLSGEELVRTGHVSFVSQWVDPATGGLAVKLAPDSALRAPIGLTVTANIIVDDRAAANTVPRAAIVTDAAGFAVLLFSDGHARRRAVKVIDWPAPRLIVTEGLAPGDVVIADATGLADGQVIRVAP